MIEAPYYVKKYSSAKERFLKQMIANFFTSELPKLFGPTLRDKLAGEIVKLVLKAMPEKEHVKPGQIVWNAIDTRTRPDSPNRRFVPVILTIIDEKDIERLTKGQPMQQIAQNAIARVTQEAHKQGGLLSMRDIGLFSWRQGADISKKRKAYEKDHETVLPHTGSLQDMGTCISHKTTIVRKVIAEKKDPLQVASETNHTLRAVENYIKDFRRVQTCHKNNQDLDFITQATGMTKHLVKQYIEILHKL